MDIKWHIVAQVALRAGQAGLIGALGAATDAGLLDGQLGAQLVALLRLFVW